MCGVERIRPELPRYRQQDAWSSIDQGVSQGRRSRFGHIGDVANADRCGARRLNLARIDVIGRQRLAMRFDEHALVGGIDEARARHAGGAAYRVQHVEESKIAV